MMVKFRKGSGVKMPEESVDKGFAGKIGVVMRVPLKQGLKRSFSRGYHTFRSCCDESSIKTRKIEIEYLPLR